MDPSQTTVTKRQQILLQHLKPVRFGHTVSRISTTKVFVQGFVRHVVCCPLCQHRNALRLMLVACRCVIVVVSGVW